jgi:hypothetical protein
MSDLMQDRIANLVDAVQKRQWPRERDAAMGIVASPKPTTRVIERKPPIGQAVLNHQLSREVGGFVEVHS